MMIESARNVDFLDVIKNVKLKSKRKRLKKQLTKDNLLFQMNMVLQTEKKLKNYFSIENRCHHPLCLKKKSMRGARPLLRLHSLRTSRSPRFSREWFQQPRNSKEEDFVRKNQRILSSRCMGPVGSLFLKSKSYSKIRRSMYSTH